MIHVPMGSHVYKGRPSPDISEPHKIGEFGVTEDGEVVMGRQFARFIYSPAINAKNLNWDLSVGFESFKAKERTESIQRILDFLILSAENKKDIKEVLNGADIVCRRSLLNTIINAPFTKESWAFDAIKRDGIIYLCERDTPEKLARKEQIKATGEDLNPSYTYWGFKFEQHITTSELEGKPYTDEPVTREEHRIFLQRTFKTKDHPPLSIAFTGEIDAIDADDNFIELKSYGGGPLNTPKFLKWKCLSWWGQSYITGIDRIVVGHKTKEGIVYNVEEVKVDTLHKQCFFDPSISLNFLVSLLDQLKAVMLHDGDAYKVHFNLDKTANFRNVATIQKASYDDVDFLSDRFLQHFQMKKNPFAEK